MLMALSPTQHSPAWETWLFWTLLTLSGGVLTFYLLSFWNSKNPLLSSLWFIGTWFPFLLVSFGQWLVLRGLGPQSAWWFLPNLPGLIWAYLYLIGYAFIHEYSSGQSLIFGSPTFWATTSQLALFALVFGALIGLLQNWLVLKSGLPLWVAATALAWGIGWPLGQQVVHAVIWTWFRDTPLSLASELLAVIVTWATIGALTGAALAWQRIN